MADEQKAADDAEAPAQDAETPAAAEAPKEAETESAAEGEAGEEGEPGNPMHLAAKSIALFVILCALYLWLWHCMHSQVPKIIERFETDRIEINDHQTRFQKVAEAMQANPWLGVGPLITLAAVFLLSLITRYWDLFSGIYFALIVVMFLLFLYGWLVFAVPLIQLQNPPSGAAPPPNAQQPAGG